MFIDFLVMGKLRNSLLSSVKFSDWGSLKNYIGKIAHLFYLFLSFKSSLSFICNKHYFFKIKRKENVNTYCLCIDNYSLQYFTLATSTPIPTLNFCFTFSILLDLLQKKIPQNFRNTYRLGSFYLESNQKLFV